MAQPVKKGSFYVPVVPVMLALLVGCAGTPSHEGKEWTQVPITDVSMVAGEWIGVVAKNAALLPEGSIRLMIRENGQYLFAGQSTFKTVVGAGSLEVRDGRLIGETDRRTVNISLYDHESQSVLAVEAVNHETGAQVRGDFTRVQ